MHIEIQNRTTTKTYGLTSAYPEKPYIKVNNSSILPLTTNTTSGLQLKVKIGSTSTSSTGYLTTAVESSELQSVTALTEAVTTGTSYLTVESSRDVSFMLTSQHNQSWKANFTNETFIITGGSNLTSTIFRTYSHTLKSANNATITTTQSSFQVRKVGGFTVTATTANAYGSRENYTATTNAFLNLYLGSIDSSTTSTSFVYRNANNDAESVYESSSSGNNEIYYTIFSTVTGTLTGESADHIPRKYLSTIYITSDTAYTATTGTSYLTSEVTTAYSGYYSSSTIIGTINTYRPLELQSASASATYYTSGIDSVGLSNVTALTRESTSGESYLTGSVSNQTTMLYSRLLRTEYTNSFVNHRISTLGTEYSYIYTRIVTSGNINSYTGTSIISPGVTISTTYFQPRGSFTYNHTAQTYTKYTPNTISSATYVESANNINSMRIFNGSFTSVSYDYNHNVSLTSSGKVTTSENYTSALYSGITTYTTVQWARGTDYYTYNTINRTTLVCDLRTSILSTTGTSYLTCESTYGYSGVSSSSSESSSWG